MRLPDTDPDKDPWTGAAIESGRNLVDETPIDESVPLMPPLGKTPAEIGAALAEPIKPEDLVDEDSSDESDQQWLQFSLADVLILMAAVGIALAGPQILPPGVFVLIAGAGTALFLMFARDREISRARFRTIVVGLLTLYVVATVATIVATAWST